MVSIKNIIFFVSILVLSIDIWGQSNKLGKVKVYASSESSEIGNNLDIQPYRIYLKNYLYFNEMKYSKNQVFELDVPVGKYNIILKQNTGELIDYERASFEVTKNKTIELRIDSFEGIRQICNSSRGIVMLPTHTIKSKNSIVPKYEKMMIDNSDLVIKYCQKRGIGNTTFDFVLLTYKNINIYADKLIVNKRNSVLQFTGSTTSPVRIEVGNCKRETKNLILNNKSLKALTRNCTSAL